MRSGMVVFVQVGESGEAIGGDFLGLTATIHLRIDGQGAASHRDDLALEGDDVASEDWELEIDAVKHKKNGVLRINILCYSKIGTLQEPLGATACKEGLVVVEVGEFDESLGIGCFHQFSVFSYSVVIASEAWHSRVQAFPLDCFVVPPRNDASRLY